jgi:hypothetical protein
MQKILFLLLILPVFSDAQINRSATELAKENIQEYLLAKIFKNQSYKPISYSELKSYRGKNSEITWTIRHKFEIAEVQNVSDKKSMDAREPYSFFFYLDKKLKVVRAESNQLY